MADGHEGDLGGNGNVLKLTLMAAQLNLLKIIELNV